MDPISLLMGLLGGGGGATGGLMSLFGGSPAEKKPKGGGVNPLPAANPTNTAPPQMTAGPGSPGFSAPAAASPFMALMQSLGLGQPAAKGSSMEAASDWQRRLWGS
jgi:hypothetical protein